MISSTNRLQLLTLAFLSLLLGIGLIFYSYSVFGYMVTLLPWVLTLAGIWLWIKGVKRTNGKRAYLKIVAGAVIFCSGIVLFRWAQLRDAALWYIFVIYLFISAYANMRPAWHPGLERQCFARYAGGSTVCAFALLLLLRPSSGLSDALQLLGVFTAAWGAFQLLLSPGRE